MATERSASTPDWSTPPGEVLAEALDERRMSQSELARRMDRPTKTINEIVNGKAAITPDTAIQLERALGISAAFWNALEAQYRERIAHAKALQELEASTGWLEGFPLKDLVRLRLIPPERRESKQVASLLAFFRVSSPAAWERQWLQPTAAFRKSAAFRSSPKSLSAWLRWGEIESERLLLARFDEAAFRDVLAEARGLTRQEPFSRVLMRLTELSSSAGVAFVITPEFQGVRTSGATRWLSSGNALIQLSLRHKSDDQFWFSFYHEAGHLLLGRRHDYIHSDDEVDLTDAEEVAADRFARELLVPSSDYKGFVGRKDFSEDAIREFARAQGIAPGIVVGRLQRDGAISRSLMNNLKKSIHIAKS
jgi:HTH-type transcriptional regulator / antitoxin HigA